VSPRCGSGGYSFREALPSFEQAGRSLLGPVATRVDAPDEVHEHVVARDEFDDVDPAEIGPVTRYEG